MVVGCAAGTDIRGLARCTTLPRGTGAKNEWVLEVREDKDNLGSRLDEVVLLVDEVGLPVEAVVVVFSTCVRRFAGGALGGETLCCAR